MDHRRLRPSTSKCEHKRDLDGQMQGTIAQIVALTTHGNAILQGAPNACSLDFQALNSTFKFCESIQFSDRTSGLLKRKESVYASHTHDWLERLKKERVYALRMSYGPSKGMNVADRMLVGFVGGGGKWLIETVGPEHSHLWESRWLVGNRDRADKKIWRVTYIRIAATNASYRENSENLERLKDEMRENLQEMAEFSRSQNLDWFTKAFESGLSRLGSTRPFEGLYHTDIAPVDFLPLSADQLLGSAEAAWVFGGMGSWNDQAFDGQTKKRYEQLSENLYNLLNRVIVAAANSGSRPKATVSS
jgi:hypothetical protein